MLRTTKLLATLSLLAFSYGASATIITETGSIDATVNNHSELDFFSFTVLSSGMVTFTVDAQGIGYMGSDLDAYVIVATDDGDRTADDIQGRNDDGGPGFDSFLSLILNAGNYIVGVSSCCISDSEFVSGENSSIAFNDSNPVYRLTIDGDVSSDSVAVSEPGTLALLGLGLLIVGRVRRKTS